MGSSFLLVGTVVETSTEAGGQSETHSMSMRLLFLSLPLTVRGVAELSFR